MAIQRSGRFERVKKPLKSEMNVVPYIDVMLVLLVIFMVTAPMITSGIKVDLPQANGNPIESKDAPTIVTLDQDGLYYLEYKGQRTGPLDLAQLTSLLVGAQTKAKDDNKELFLGEAADLLFHYLVLLEAKNYSLDEVVEVLKQRHTN